MYARAGEVGWRAGLHRRDHTAGRSTARRLSNPAGCIVELIAIKRLSEAFNNLAIWRNALYAVITAIVGTVVLSASIFAFFFGFPLLHIHIHYI
jgi:uncharacterized membrane protein